MSEGLEWLFEINAKTAGLDGMLKQVDVAAKTLPAAKEATTALDKEFNKLSATLTQLKRPKQIEEIKKQIEELAHPKHENALQRLLHAGIEPFANRLKNIAEFEFIRRGVDAVIDAPAELIAKVKELGEEAINTAAKAERMELSFKLTLGAAGAENVLGWIDKIASKTEFTDDQLKGFVNELTRSGVAAKDLDKYLAAAGDLAAMGADPSAAIGALARANLTGKIEGRILRPLGISTRDLGQLDQFRGKTEKQIQKSLETTAISREDLLRLIAGPDKMLGDKMLLAGKTLQAELTHLKDLPDQFFQKLAKSPGMEVLKTEIGSILEKLDPDSPTGKKISGFLNDAFVGAANLLKDVDLGAKIDLFTNGMKGFADIAGPVLRFAYHELEGIAYLIGRITGHTKSTEDQKKDITGESMLRIESFRMAHGGQGIRVDKPVTAGDLEFNREQEQKAQAAHLKALEEARATFSSPQAFDDAVLAMKVNGERLGGALVDGARGPKGIDAHSPSKKFAELGEMAADGFEDGFDSDGAFAAPAARPGQGPTVGGGSAHVNVPSIVVNMNGATGNARADGQAAAEGLAEVFLPQLVRVLEQLQREQGA